MSKWLYIMATSDNSFFHLGFSDDILKVIKFYKSLPQISSTPSNRLVYAEEYTLKESQQARFNELTKSTHEQLKSIIQAVNPELLELRETDIVNQ